MMWKLDGLSGLEEGVVVGLVVRGKANKYKCARVGSVRETTGS